MYKKHEKFIKVFNNPSNLTDALYTRTPLISYSSRRYENPINTLLFWVKYAHILKLLLMVVVLCKPVIDMKTRTIIGRMTRDQRTNSNLEKGWGSKSDFFLVADKFKSKCPKRVRTTCRETVPFRLYHSGSLCNFPSHAPNTMRVLHAAIDQAWPTLSQFWSFKIRQSMNFIQMRNVDRRILRLQTCKRVGRGSRSVIGKPAADMAVCPCLCFPSSNLIYFSLADHPPLKTDVRRRLQ